MAYHDVRGGNSCRPRQKREADPPPGSGSQPMYLTGPAGMIGRLITRFGMLLFVSVSASAYSAERQEIPPVLKAIEDYVRSETAGFPGEVSFSVGTVDPRHVLSACPLLKPFVPAGGRLWGRTAVGVRCNGPMPWTLYVPLHVRVMGNVVHAAKPLVQGQLIGPADVVLQKADLAQLPAGIITEPGQAIGKTLSSSITSGLPLRQDLLRSPVVVLQGQTIKLLARGPGFSVSSEGKALAAAADGQVVPVRTHSGQIISGIARPDGVVEVRP